MAQMLDYFSKGWARVGPHLGSRQRTGEILKTLVIVVPLTLLIWIYAERAQSTTDSIEIAPQIALGDPALTASIVAPSTAAIQLEFYGPRVQNEALKREISQRAMNNTLTLTMPAALAKPGQQNVDVATALRADPLFANSGVAITKATPTYVTVGVSRVIPREVTVALPQDAAIPVTLQNVTFDPPRVTVKGPEPEMEQIYPTDSGIITVDLANQYSNFTGIGTKTIELPLKLPSGYDKPDKLSITPATVKMTFDIGSREQQVTIGTVFIYVEKLLSTEKSVVTVRTGPAINNVTIRGPASVVNQFVGDNPPLRLKAVLQIKPEDVGKTDLHGPLEITGLPPDVKLVGPQREVDYDVRGGNGDTE